MQNLQGGGIENKLMSELATQIVMEKALEDKITTQQAPDIPEEQDEDEVAIWRRKRIEEMKAKQQEIQENISHRGHGEYQEITQDEFLPSVTKSKNVVCHFYHDDFERCRIIDHHLGILAKYHPETKFIKINAEKSPFFVQKLGIKVLPTTVLFDDGKAIDRVLGFEGVSNQDEFPTSAFAKRLAKAKVITPKNQQESASESEDD